MTVSKASELVNKQIEETGRLKSQRAFLPVFKKWKRDTEIVLEKIFGAGSRHLEDFRGVKYNLNFYGSGVSDEDIQARYIRGLEDAAHILKSMVQEILEFGLDNSSENSKTDPLRVIENICNRFHLVARQLRSRHGGRSSLEIEDEYDVQDLFHALLHLYSADIRAEEWTPSYAGGGARVDFLLKQEQTVVEIKKTRKNLTTKDIGEQLIIDIKRYQVHPDCKCLLCFVYDPEGRIGNPAGLENDLTDRGSDFTVVVIVAPKGI